jgi:acetyl-CoA C-acetyltransferase/acetyl-CoA acyltransferase
MPAVTVHRNCASGMECLTSASTNIAARRAKAILVVGTESMSSLPLFFNKSATQWLTRLSRSRSTWSKLTTLAAWRPHMMQPDIGVLIGLHDKVAGIGMGETAEILADEFAITRSEQDAYALQSHQRACAAQAAGFFDHEIAALHPLEHPRAAIDHDDGPRPEQSLQALGKLKPAFRRPSRHGADGGTVTAGNACPLTDGAVAMLVCNDDFCRAHGLKPLGYLNDFAYVGCDDQRMGLGPVYATQRLLHNNPQWRLADFERIELNEAFAAQALACYKAFECQKFCQENFGSSNALGSIDPDRCNVHGGAIALGHPVGSTGLRLVLTLLRNLHRNGLQHGLATLCIGGGQGAALGLEAA